MLLCPVIVVPIILVSKYLVNRVVRDNIREMSMTEWLSIHE